MHTHTNILKFLTNKHVLDLIDIYVKLMDQHFIMDRELEDGEKQEI